MVRLNKIYTKTGDDGGTHLGDGSRLPKHHQRVASYGSVDELNATLGCVLVQVNCGADLREILRQTQNDLLDLGGDLCCPVTHGDQTTPALRIRAEDVLRLEAWIDQCNERLEPLKSFVLPGGSPLAAELHRARTVCRRAERDVSLLMSMEEESERVNPQVV